MRRTDHQAGGEIQGDPQIHLGKPALPKSQVEVTSHQDEEGVHLAHLGARPAQMRQQPSQRRQALSHLKHGEHAHRDPLRRVFEGIHHRMQVGDQLMADRFGHCLDEAGHIGKVFVESAARNPGVGHEVVDGSRHRAFFRYDLESGMQQARAHPFTPPGGDGRTMVAGHCHRRSVPQPPGRHGPPARLAAAGWDGGTACGCRVVDAK